MIDITKLNLDLTSDRFMNYRQVFYEKVIKSPISVELLVVTSTTSGTIKDFLGANTQNLTANVLPCLFEYNKDSTERDKIGLSDTGSASIYLSPLQLEPLYGDYKFDFRNIKVVLLGHLYIVEKIDYLHNIFDSCIAVEFTCKEDIRG